MIEEVTTQIVPGYVREGVIVPKAPLPEDACVDIHVKNYTMQDSHDEMRGQLAMWQEASMASMQWLINLEAGDACNSGGVGGIDKHAVDRDNSQTSARHLGG